MSCYRVLPDVLPAGDEVERVEHVHLPPHPRVVGDARRFVREHAPPLPDTRLDDLLLLTSELVTNAVIHARTEIELGITTSRASVLVTVHDLDLGRPEQAPYADREGGWGLGVVRDLAEDAAMQRFEDDGKTAWFRLRRAGGAGD